MTVGHPFRPAEEDASCLVCKVGLGPYESTLTHDLCGYSSHTACLIPWFEQLEADKAIASCPHDRQELPRRHSAPLVTLPPTSPTSPTSPLISPPASPTPQLFPEETQRSTQQEIEYQTARLRRYRDIIDEMLLSDLTEGWYLEYVRITAYGRLQRIEMAEANEQEYRISVAQGRQQEGADLPRRVSLPNPAYRRMA